MSEWKPIGTAPRTGRWVLVWWDTVTDAPFAAYWREGRWVEAFSGCDYRSQPTHWMPMPPPPEPPDALGTGI